MPRSTPTRIAAASRKPGRADRAQLRQLEDVIETARRWQLEEARALLTIRDRRLYRLTHHTFEAYGMERWGFEHAHLYRLCAWAEVADAVSPIGDIPLRESHARPLFGLSPEQQRDAWREVIRRVGVTRTADCIAAMVQEHLVARAPTAATKPSPQRLSGQVVVGDSRERLHDLGDGTVDLILFSPPYAMQRARDYPSVTESEYPDWMVSVLDAAKEKLAPRGSVLVVIREHVRGGAIPDYLLRTRLAVREAGWHEIDVLMWSKADAPPTGRSDRPRRAYESIYWWSRTTTPFCDPQACGSPMAEPRERMARHRTLKSGHHGTNPYMRFRAGGIARITDVIDVPIGTSTAGIKHPAPYPMPLADKLIRTFSPVGGLVADPMAGSGTSLVAARDAGRRYWGCDLVPEYVAAARDRLGR
jgi:DNA modification methylase